MAKVKAKGEAKAKPKRKEKAKPKTEAKKKKPGVKKPRAEKPEVKRPKAEAADYDAVIIGSGISGLGMGALLAQAGKKVVVLEKSPVIGGRAFSFSHRGHVMNIGGPRAGLLGGKVDQLFSRVGKEPGERELFEDIVTYREGKLVSFASLVSPAELIKLYQSARAVEAADLEDYDNLPGPEWLDLVVDDPMVRDIGRFTGIVMTTIPQLEDIAASSLISSIRIGLKYSTTYLPAHGYSDYMRILAGALAEKGGEVRPRARVTKVVIEDKQVRGVTVEERKGEGEKISRSEISIQAPLVITAFPIWNLFKLVGEDNFSLGFVELVKHLKRRATIFGISAAMREPIFTGKGFLMTDLPRTQHPLSAFMASNVAPSLSPQGEHLFEACCQCDPELGQDRPRFQKLIRLMKEDLEEMFPGWEKKCLWIKPYFHWVEAARNPGREGVFRPGIKAPGIEGLYFAGDTVESRSTPGLECASESAIICAQEILGNLP